MEDEGEDLLLLDRNRCLRCWLCVLMCRPGNRRSRFFFSGADGCAIVAVVPDEWSKCLRVCCCRLTACTCAKLLLRQPLI